MSSVDLPRLSLGRARPTALAVVLVALAGCQLVLPGRGQQQHTDAGTGSSTAALGEAGGALPDGATAFDVEHPGVAELDADLLRAVRAATTSAAGDGVEVVVNSGWRSAAYQAQLLRDAVAEHGSEQEAARWVATPTASAHVTGDAVDIGDVDARTWLSDHGAEHGLCQVYDNEPWHFELRPEAVEQGCPPRFSDPTRDPRMH